VGRSRADYEATARELDALLRRLVALMIGGPPRDAMYAAHAGSSPSRGAVGEAGYVTGRA
jgi:hypothetical protein